MTTPTPKPDFKAALSYTFDINANGLSRRATYDGAYECFKYHGETIRTALLIADKVMGEPSEGMLSAGNLHADQWVFPDASYHDVLSEVVFKAMIQQLLKEIDQ